MEKLTRTRDYITVFGINHESCGLDERQKFSLTEHEYSALLTMYASKGIENIFVLNTCNRTEVYCLSQHLSDALNSFRLIKNIDNETLHQALFIKHDHLAIQHFFNVGAGMSSKILGDYQIIGQMRKSYHDACDNNLISTRFERLFQALFKACKAVKNQTGFNHGAASHGYVVASLIKQLQQHDNASILILGSGDMARRTLNHVRDHSLLPITIANRTVEKLAVYKGLANVNVIGLENLHRLVQEHSVIINTIPILDWISETDLGNVSNKTIFDLAVPSVIGKIVNGNENKIYDLEAIEQYTQNAISERESYLPQVTSILNKHIEEYQAFTKQNRQNDLFKKFESELKQFLSNDDIIETQLINNEQFSKQITQLFMKQFYAGDRPKLNALKATFL